MIINYNGNKLYNRLKGIKEMTEAEFKEAMNKDFLQLFKEPNIIDDRMELARKAYEKGISFCLDMIKSGQIFE